MYIEPITSCNVSLTKEEFESLEKAIGVLIELLNEMGDRGYNCVECVNGSISDNYTFNEIDDVRDILTNLVSIDSIYNC